MSTNVQPAETLASGQTPQTPKEKPIKPKDYPGSQDLYEREVFLCNLRDVEEGQIETVHKFSRWLKEAEDASSELDLEIARTKARVAALRISQREAIKSLQARFDRLNK